MRISKDVKIAERPLQIGCDQLLCCALTERLKLFGQIRRGKILSGAQEINVLLAKRDRHSGKGIRLLRRK